jgi:hypothetical protein
MFLPESMKSTEQMDLLSEAVLYPIDINVDTRAVEEKLGEKLTLSNAVKQHSKAAGTVCFVVRRPG